MSQDNVSRAFNYIDTRIAKVKSCIESYITKAGTVSNATMIAILKSTENETIKLCNLPNTRGVRNGLRDYILQKLGSEE